ncbi:helix-turn-helix transcriptional regulator [Idiomarina tyrosinivorans]|uniref:Helix-turn-helix transcriptional regulator n=1 Tax=Idiomarina tyrosinivorans TaxID=1445662 RepID=A0A432ZTP5_9GAMM|nr:LuxR C-terminal-related transcriptional regulator [Idiomarina tyrosinivorans]RUO81259.1 helix-turn-helix transcriptional regulator [Idiomarina tyrosinivorans]
MSSIILAVPNAIIRTGMQTLLEQNFNDDCVTVTSVNQLRQACHNHDDAIVILFSRLGGDATVELWRRLQRRHCELQLIVLGETYQDVLDFQCGLPQVDAYLLNDGRPEELISAVRALKTGCVFVASGVAEYLAKNPRTPNKQGLVDRLSDRELQVAQMLSRGVRVVDIAKHLSISSKTINTFRYRIFAKLGINSDVQLSHMAIQAGLVDLIQFERP